MGKLQGREVTIFPQKFESKSTYLIQNVSNPQKDLAGIKRSESTTTLPEFRDRYIVSSPFLFTVHVYICYPKFCFIFYDNSGEEIFCIIIQRQVSTHILSDKRNATAKIKVVLFKQ